MSKIEGEKEKTMLLKTMEGNTRKISKRVAGAHRRKRQKAGAKGSSSRREGSAALGDKPGRALDVQVRGIYRPGHNEQQKVISILAYFLAFLFSS